VRALKVALYARVSKDDEVMDPLNQLLPMRQVCAAKGWKVIREYVDRAGATDLRGRGEWREMIEDAERGRFQLVLCAALDRCFRSILHAADYLNRLEGYDVALKSLREEWADGTTPSGKLMLTIIVAFAEFERDTIRVRTKAGLQRARSQGKRLGHPRRLNGEFEALRADVLAGTVSQREAARRLGVSPRTIARALRHNRGQIGPSLGPANQCFADAAGGE
jgi:DNA invertase Pin-like site-specific DNA recombinase